MIQDIAPWKLRIEFCPLRPSPEDFIFDFTQEGLLLRQGDALSFPTLKDWLSLHPDCDESRLIFAFRLEHEDDAEREMRFFLVLPRPDSSAPHPEGWERLPARALWGYGWGWPAFAGITAFHLYSWYDTRRFCGRCATPLLPGAKERSLVCPKCGNTEYPSIPPSVLIAVTDGDRLLLTRYNRPGASRYVLVAGYVEAGETAEQTAAREVLEETGVRIKNIRYIGSQPWGLSGTLSLAFTAELDGPGQLEWDKEELAEALWLDRADIPPVPDEESITMKIISSFRRGEF
ncbi:MAG: NAD(+) diphosphatase [Mailhella sp.]|nr:NAD(+) diphosphatase [Mailhella sp.]